MKGHDGCWLMTVRVFTFSLIILSTVVADESASFEDQPQKSSVYTRHVKPSGTKPKKYKCILVDDDDETPSQNLAGVTSYVSELQQRRLQAANFAEKTQIESQQPRIATPVVSRTITPQQSIPNRVVSTTNNQQSRSSSGFGIPRAEEASIAGFKNKPLKQITLTRPSQTSQPAYNQPQQNTTSKPPMKLSQEYCNMIRSYAALYNVQDVLGWVSKNCAFAKQYLPNATCAEINTLVASCYRFFNKS